VTHFDGEQAVFLGEPNFEAFFIRIVQPAEVNRLQCSYRRFNLFFNGDLKAVSFEFFSGGDF
jgi:hypothetical protein